MRFLIVIPKYILKVGNFYDFPLGFAYVAASMKKAGFAVECLNLNGFDEREEDIIAKTVLERNIDVLCTGGLSIHYRKIKKILDTAKQANPDIITVLGSGIFSSEPELILRNLPVDIGIIGEGEKTMVELAEALVNAKPYNTVKGIAFVDAQGEVVITPERPPIDDLASLPFPDFDGFGVKQYLDLLMVNDSLALYPVENPRMLPIISSRSCPYECTFCFHPLGKKYRQRPLDDFFAELDILIEKYHVNIITVFDELFSINKSRIREFCERIKQYNIKWLTQMRVDSVDEESLQLMKDSGCFLVSYGLESACNSILKSIKKHITVEQIEKALEITKKVGLGIQGNFIFGHPDETWETANETLNWWLKHKEYQLFLITLGVFPGTEVYMHALDKGLITDKANFLLQGCPIINVSMMSTEEYKKLLIKINHHLNEIWRAGKTLYCEKLRDDPYKGEIYRVKIECPHCHHINDIKKFNVGFNVGFFITHCQDCNQRFSLNTADFDKKLNAKLERIFGEVDSGKVAVFAAGDFTQLRLLPALQDKGRNVECIFDNNTLKHGMYVNGVEIRPLPDDFQQVKEIADAIIISAPDFEDEIYQQISFLEKEGIAVYRLSMNCGLE